MGNVLHVLSRTSIHETTALGLVRLGVAGLLCIFCIQNRLFCVNSYTALYLSTKNGPPRWPRRPPRERKSQDSNPACAGIFSGSSHTSNGYPARRLAL